MTGSSENSTKRQRVPAPSQISENHIITQGVPEPPEQDSPAYRSVPATNCDAIQAVFCGDLGAIRAMDKTIFQQKDNLNRSAVHASCWMGRTDILRYLIDEAGCSVHDVDVDGKTAVHYCLSVEWPP